MKCGTSLVGMGGRWLADAARDLAPVERPVERLRAAGAALVLRLLSCGLRRRALLGRGLAFGTGGASGACEGNGGGASGA